MDELSHFDSMIYFLHVLCATISFF